MPCYSPLKGYQSKSLTKKGKRKLVFSLKDAYVDKPLEVSCGQCIGCRLERSRQWAIRCMHESSLYDDNCFITLTYSNDYLPENYSLVKRDLQLFFKRLRRKFPNDTIRYYACGEYGESTERPHYHACLFNFDFRDKVIIQKTDNINYYISDCLSTIWHHGYSVIGDLTFQSAAYVARYCTKIITGDKAHDHYGNREKEFSLMSKGRKNGKGGIGKCWYDKFKYDTYKDDTVIINGHPMKPPKYYDKLFLEDDDPYFNKIRIKRLQKLDKVDKYEFSGTRLLTKEKVKVASLSHLKRPIG